MKKIELSIHRDYVPDWGVWEGAREIMQNAMDENDKGHRISVSHDGDVLTIGNDGSNLMIQHLLIGFTTKKDDIHARGEKGEGLDLGLLALVRDGLTVEVRTPTEKWTPVLERSKKWDAEVLFINVEKMKEKSLGTYIKIGGISEEDWDSLKERFIDLHSLDEDDVISDNIYGQLLLHPRFSGNIYVKGIYVTSDNQLRFGYNFFQAKLDRDRRVVDSFDLSYYTSKLLGIALVKRPEKMKKIIWNMINNEVKDVAGLNQWNLDHSVKEQIKDMFVDEHGQEAVPVASIGDSEEMNYLGRRGVVVPRVLREVIGGLVDSPEEIKSSMKGATKRDYSWDELEEDEREVLRRIGTLVDGAVGMFRGNMNLCKSLMATELYSAPEDRVMNMMKVVDFRKDELVGLADLLNNEIRISKESLSNYFVALRAVIHEYAHVISHSGDGKRDHSYTIETIWMAIQFYQDGN